MRTNCHCLTGKKPLAKKAELSIIGGLIVALVPKCPFCIVAFSSAITVCGGKGLYAVSPTWTPYLAVGLALFTLIVTWINFKGKQTMIASLILLTGIMLIVFNEFYMQAFNTYYLGSFFLMLGVWYNGSFLFFYRKIRKGFQAQLKKIAIT